MAFIIYGLASKWEWWNFKFGSVGACDVIDKSGCVHCPLGLVMITVNHNFV